MSREGWLSILLWATTFALRRSKDSGRIEGKVAEVNLEEVDLEYKGQASTQSLEAITAVYRRGNVARTGAIIGGVAVGIVGAVAASGVQSEMGESSDGDDGSSALLVGIVGAAAGALVGALIGSRIQSWDKVYPASALH